MLVLRVAEVDGTARAILNSMRSHLTPAGFAGNSSPVLHSARMTMPPTDPSARRDREAPPAAPSVVPIHRAGAENDRDLLRRMADGDEGALAAFYDRWARSVHALILHMIGDADECEDIVEETFWQAWRSAARYDTSRGAVSTWLLTIARSRALDRLRARRRLREEPLPPRLDDSGDAETSAPGPALDAESAERRRIVLAALAELPAEQREALELAYYGGLSQSEIAERTGQPLGTVKTRVRLALLKLRDRLRILQEELA
jgi:RNA polymerase sigma-70 factor (ECF subfamily)